jgi:hypothetical protein
MMMMCNIPHDPHFLSKQPIASGSPFIRLFKFSVLRSFIFTYTLTFVDSDQISLANKFPVTGAATYVGKSQDRL